MATGISATIITIGDELLIGQVIDSNSAWMAQELNKSGIWLKRRVAVGDKWDDIWKCLDEELAAADIVLVTGGLGPTADDITKPLLCEYFGARLVVDPGALANVKDIFERVLKRPMIERNLKQAEVPDNCTVIQNKRGTAPGMWFEKNERVLVSMPGVPFEMKGMMLDYVLPALSSRYSLPTILHRTLLVAGIGESFLADHINKFETSLPDYIKLAYLPNFGMVRLRLTGTSSSEALISKELDAHFDVLKQLVKEWLVVDEDISLQQAVGRWLSQSGGSLGTAESCTGGYIAQLLTSVPGSSAYFKGSVVSYANEVKQNLLRVRPETLESHGAVSEQTVREMAQGGRLLLDCDYCVATSGIMGPDGGTELKPVGTVWIAVAGKGETRTQKFWFRFDRQRNIELTANNALNMLRKCILKLPE